MIEWVRTARVTNGRAIAAEAANRFFFPLINGVWEGTVKGDSQCPANAFIFDRVGGDRILRVFPGDLRESLWLWPTECRLPGGEAAKFIAGNNFNRSCRQ